MFDVAIYTDTRADEAIDGIDGFNFRAVSEGITAQDKQAIRDNMLHRVVVGWGVDHDPLAHPPTFVYYNHGGRYLLAKGISTGVTNNGRPGNLLTQAIVTSDPDDFASMRPAQLFGAVNWRMERGTTKSIDQWAAPLEIEPEFETDGLCHLVKDDEWATQRLPEFLTMVEQVTAEDSKRLVIICSDPVLAQRWIALGTLFIDCHKALSLTIRGLVQDPMITKGDIVAATPAFGPQPDATAPRAGVNIIDLDKRQLGSIQPSGSALIQAKWFLQEDSATALAAIELAGRWDTFLGRELATRAAATASFPGEQGSAQHWRSAMTALKELARHNQTDELFFYGDALIDSAVTYAPQSEEEARLAASVLVALLTVGSHDLAVGVLLPSLEAVSSDATLRDAWLSAVAEAPENIRLIWEDEEARQLASAHLSMMADEVAPDMLPAVLADVHMLQIPLADFSHIRAVQGLAELWARTPTLSAQWSRWAYGQELLGSLAQMLERNWTRGDRAALKDLTSSKWEWLETEPWRESANLRNIRPWFEAASLARLPVTERAFAMTDRLPPESWAIVWGGVALPSDTDLIDRWATTQGSVSEAAGRWLFQEIKISLRAGEPATRIRDLLVRLSQSDIRVLDPRLDSLSRQVATADSYFGLAVTHWNAVPNIYLKQAVQYLPDMSALMHDYVGEVILTCKDVRGVSRIVAASEDWAEASTLAALKRRRDTEENMRDALLWALILVDDTLDAPAQAAQDFLLAVSDDRRYRALASRAASGLDRRTRGRLDDFMKDAGKGRIKRRFTRVASDFLSRKDRER